MLARELKVGDVFCPLGGPLDYKRVVKQIVESANTGEIVIEDEYGFVRVYHPDEDVPGTAKMTLTDAVQIFEHVVEYVNFEDDSAATNERVVEAWNVIKRAYGL